MLLLVYMLSSSPVIIVSDDVKTYSITCVLLQCGIIVYLSDMICCRIYAPKCAACGLSIAPVEVRNDFTVLCLCCEQYRSLFTVTCFVALAL